MKKAVDAGIDLSTVLVEGLSEGMGEMAKIYGKKGMYLDRLGYTADNPLGIRMAGPIAGLAALTGFIAFRSYSHATVVPGEKQKAMEETE